MFYRRKILLALLEAFGGSLTPIDCRNLLLLFCLRRGKSYYDFFPHTSGPYSFLLCQDKARLISLGLLVAQDAFIESDQERFFPQILKEDQFVLQALVMEMGRMSSEELMQWVYLEYPFIASRSKTALPTLSHSEYIRVQQVSNTDATPCLFTLGYEGLSIDAYVNILLANNITALIDVRKNPLSMKYGFSKTKLCKYLGQVNIAYFHIPNLGISSVLRKDLNDVSAYESLFDYYRLHILPEQKQAIEQVKAIANAQNRTALTCFEANAHYCHRHEITEYLEKDVSFTLPVIHLRKTCTCGTSSVYTTANDVLHIFPEPVNV